jgi:hypothetical protein
MIVCHPHLNGTTLADTLHGNGSFRPLGIGNVKNFITALAYIIDLHSIRSF